MVEKLIDALIANWPLVAIGIPGIWAAVVTLRAVRKQTEALIESQRPRIASSAHGDCAKDLLSATPRIQLELVNKGVTTAHALIWESWIELRSDETSDFSSAAYYYKSSNPTSLYPNHEPLVINIPLPDGLSPDQRAALKGLRLFALIRVHVSFRDAFSSDRYASFGYFVRSDGLGFLPKYNDSN